MAYKAGIAVEPGVLKAPKGSVPTPVPVVVVQSFKARFNNLSMILFICTLHSKMLYGSQLLFNIVVYLFLGDGGADEGHRAMWINSLGLLLSSLWINKCSLVFTWPSIPKVSLSSDNMGQ